MEEFSRKKIGQELTLADKLKTLRRRKHVSLEVVEEETRVRLKYLQALEKGAYEVLPADVYSVGFLAKYAEFLGGNKNELTEQFRRERGALRGPQLLIPLTQSKETKVILSPKIIVVALIFLAIAVLLGYIFYSVKNFTSAPNLEISSPSTETVIRQETIEIIGKTDDGATLMINDQTVLIDDRGNFQEEVKLQPGLNNIEVRATNRLKKETVKVIKILAEF